jgi:hypothetical protein
MRDLLKPLKFETTFLSTHLNIDRDSIIGTFTLKEIQEDVEKRLNGVYIELFQQELQGASKNSMHPPDSMVGDRLASMNGVSA